MVLSKMCTYQWTTTPVNLEALLTFNILQLSMHNILMVCVFQILYGHILSHCTLKEGGVLVQTYTIHYMKVVLTKD